MPTKHRAIEILRFGFGRLRGTKRNRRRASWRPRIEGLEERSLLSLSTISVSDPAFYGVSGMGSARSMSVSADGRYAAFVSDANDLVSNDYDYFSESDVFLRDMVTGTTTLVSGTAVGNGESDLAVISEDGKWLAFRSTVYNLVPGETNYGNNLYVRDLVNGVTQRISVNTDGSTPTSTFYGGRW